MSKVAVVILNYKMSDLTVKCVKSVLNSEYGNLEVIVVDNGSEDGLAQKMDSFKEIVFIQNGENLGFTGGYNVGLKRALEGQAEFILILNPDAWVERTTVSALLGGFKDEKVGAVGPKIFFEDGKTIWFAGGIFDTANVLGSHRGVDEKDEGQFNEAIEVDYITGAAMMIKRQVLEKVGLFDERYFLYYEDSDLSFRIKKAGYKLMYIPEAVVFHKNAQSTGLGSPLQDYFITRNRLLFASKFLPFRTRFALLREAVRNFGKPVRRLALRDFLQHKFGKGSYLR